MATSTFDLTGTQVGSPLSGEYLFSLASGTSPVLVRATNSTLSMIRLDVSEDSDGNAATYAISGQLLGSGATALQSSSGVLTLIDSVQATAGPETWRADFKITQTFALIPDSATDADLKPDGFYFKDELANTVPVTLAWLAERAADGALATFSQVVNQASAQDAGSLFSGRVLDLNNDGTPDQIKSTLGTRSNVANLSSVSDLSWQSEYTQSITGRVLANSAGQVAGFYFALSDMGSSLAWQLSTLGSATGSPASSELYLKLGTATSGSGALVKATSDLFPTLSFDLSADTDANPMTYAAKGTLLSSSGQSQTSKGTLTFSDTLVSVAGPDAWTARFLVKESLTLIPDTASDADTLIDGFVYTDSLNNAVQVPFVWKSATASDGTMATFSATINQLSSSDSGMTLSGKLLDTNANGVADHLQLSVGGKTLYGTLQSAGTSWKLYYNVDLSGRTANDDSGNVLGMYFDPSNLSYVTSYAVAPSGFDVNVKFTYWKSWGSSSATALSGVSLTEGGVSGVSASTGRVSLSGVEDLDGTEGDGVFQLAPAADAPSNAKSAISLTDVLAALKIYLGKPLPDSYASPMATIAADFDASGSVNLSDVLLLLKYYLGKSTSTQPAWTFIDSNDLSGTGSSAVLQSGTSGTSVSKSLTTLKAISHDFSASASDLELIGVLRGDVDGSWTSA